jgi:hypothetical protein
MRKLVTLAFLLTCLSVIESTPALACIPVPESYAAFSNKFDRADIAFIGVVKSIDKNENEFVFEVIKAFKNITEESRFSGKRGSICDFDAPKQVGEIWFYSSVKPKPGETRTYSQSSGFFLLTPYGETSALSDIENLKQKTGYDVLTAKLPLQYGPPVTEYNLTQYWKMQKQQGLPILPARHYQAHVHK